MWKRRSQRVKQWWDPVGRPQHTILVICRLFLSFPLLSIYICTFFFQHIITHLNLIFFFFSWQMNLLMRKFPGLRHRRRKTLTCSAAGYKPLLEVGSLSLSFMSVVHMAFCSPLYSYPCISLSFYLSGVGPAEKGYFPEGRSPHVGS